MPKEPDSDTSVPVDAGLNPLEVLYLNPRMVTVAPPVAETLPFKVEVVPVVLLAAKVDTVGAAMQDDVV